MWFFSKRKTANAQRAGRVPLSFRPRLEALEDRCLLSAGALDPTFGNGAGYVSTAVTNSTDVATTVLLQPNGKILDVGQGQLVGKHDTFADSDFAAVRYNSDGSLDTSFGSGGIALASPPSIESGVAVHAYWAALYPNAGTANDGKIVVEGWYPVPQGKNAPSIPVLALVRFNANGTLDNTFGSGGFVTTSFSTGGTNLSVIGAGVVVTSSGQIVECGQGNSTDTVLARYNANGTLDTTFGQGGKVITMGPGTSYLIQEPNGQLLVVGNVGNSGAIFRYNANGTLDTTFGSGGVVTNPAFGIVWAAAVYPAAGTANDGKIVVAGGGGPNGGWEVARYSPNGTLDSTFGSGGMVNTPTGSSNSYARSVALQSDGRIVVSGDGSILVRYNADGSLDTTFGNGGIDTTTVPASTLRSVVLQPNGDIVVAGQASTFLVARFLPSEPQVGSFTASPNPVIAGSSTTLTASNITDGNPGVSITQVAFYLDSNNDGTLEPGTDILLGDATQTSAGVWTLTSSSAFGLTAGTYTLFAQAQDSDGVLGDPIALTLTVQ
jgi:uncharacterized delta-60 repeat protein